MPASNFGISHLLVAARCGYSIAAVSKAINGRPDINRDTAQRIRGTARVMGYVPNTAARTLSTKTSRIIGLLFFIKGMTIWEHEYFSRIASSVQEVAEQRGYDIAPVNISKKHILGSCADYCRHRNYDGVLVHERLLRGQRPVQSARGGVGPGNARLRRRE